MNIGIFDIGSNTIPFLRKSLRPFQLRLTSGRGACILCAVDIH